MSKKQQKELKDKRSTPESRFNKNGNNRKFSRDIESNWDTFNPVMAYDKIHISSIWPLPTGMKLYYLFDFGGNWIFQINKTRHKDKIAQPGIKYPRVIEAKGKNPEQYPDWDDEDY